MLIQDIKRIKVKKQVDYFDLHPEEQKKVDEAYSEWELSKYGDRELIRELWRRKVGEVYILGTYFELEEIAGGQNSDEREMESELEIELEEIC